MLEKLKLILGVTDKDELLRVLLDRATNEVINYTHNNELEKLEYVILDIAIWRYNRIKSEGLDSENYSGVSFNYSADYPDSIKKQLQAYRRIKTL